MLFSLMTIRRDTGARKNAALAVFFVASLHGGVTYLALQMDAGFEKDIPRTIDVELVPLIEVAPSPQVAPVTRAAPTKAPTIIPPQRVVTQPVVVARVFSPDPVATEAVAEAPIEREPSIVEAAEASTDLNPSPPAVVTAQDIIAPRFDADYLNNPSPPYPAAARRLRLQGTVVLRVTVSDSGLPLEIRVVQSSGASILDQAALKVVRDWTFVPARQGVEKISAAVDVPIRFVLN